MTMTSKGTLQWCAGRPFLRGAGRVKGKNTRGSPFSAGWAGVGRTSLEHLTQNPDPGNFTWAQSMGHRSNCQMLLKLNLKRKKSMFTVYYVFSVNPPTPTPHHLQKAIHFGMQQLHNLLDGGPDAKSITFKKTIKGAIFIYPLLFYPTLYSSQYLWITVFCSEEFIVVCFHTKP